MAESASESSTVLRAWKERWTDKEWLQELIKHRFYYDSTKLSYAFLDLLAVGKLPNSQVLHLLELAIACQALPLCAFVKAIHSKVKNDSLDLFNCLITMLSNYIPNFRDETDIEDSGKLPTSLLTLVEWLVYVQVNAIKQLSIDTEKKCLSLFGGCTTIIQAISDDILLRSLAPLWGSGRWRDLITASQNIHIPLDSCSEEGKKTLASSLISFVRNLEEIQPAESSQAVNNNLFNLPCVLMLHHDILQHGGLCTAAYFRKAAKYYRCSLQKVCIEWGKAHLQVIHDNKNCQELALALLLYKYPSVLTQLFNSPKQSEIVVVHLLEQDVMWARVCSLPDWNIVLPFLQSALQHKLISATTYETLKEKKASEQTTQGMVDALQIAERTLDEVCEMLNFCNYSPLVGTQIISLLEGFTCSSNTFTELLDRIFYVAVAKGELQVLMCRICNVIEQTCDGASQDQSEEQNRIALFDVSCLLLVRCCMMFGSDIVSESKPFCRWLGSHVCGPHNPLRLLLPLVHPQQPPNHTDNVANLMQFFAGDSILNTVSLQNVLIAMPDALGDMMNSLKSDSVQIIKDDTFNKQIAKLRDCMIVPVFVAIHWLIHFKETVYEDYKSSMFQNYLMKPFLKPHSMYTSNVLLTQRIEILQKSLNTTIRKSDLKLKKAHLMKKPFWVNGLGERDTKQDIIWDKLRTNPTLETLSLLFISDNVADIVYRATIQVVNKHISDDVRHVVFTSAVFLQTDPRYVPWLLNHTIPDLLNEGLPSRWKSYIWALAQLAFLATDLYLVHTELEPLMDRPLKRVCRSKGLESADRCSMIRDALATFWREMREIAQEEGFSYRTAFLHRFVRCGVEYDRDTLKSAVSVAPSDTLKHITKHLVQHDLVEDGVTLLQLGGASNNACSSLLQEIL